MSRWIAKGAGYQFIARADRSEYVALPNGTTQPRVVESMLSLDFQHRALSPYERLAAVKHWAKKQRRDGTWDAFGAYPNAEPMPAAHDAMGRVTQWTEAFSPDQRFSVYGTDWLPEAERDFADQALRSYQDNGMEYIEVLPEAVPPPWPAYDKLDGRAVAKLREKVLEDGYDPHAVLAYERATKNRSSFVACLEEIIAESAARSEEEAALRVTVQ
jgi:hypothetical protein